jgi:hypothetical protein
MELDTARRQFFHQSDGRVKEGGQREEFFSEK